MATLPPPGETPAYKAVVVSHGDLVRGLYELTERRLRVVIREQDLRQAQWVPLALYLQILQLGQAVQLLVQSGYADEALPLTRGMMSSTFNLAFIVTRRSAKDWSFHFYRRTFDEQQKFFHRELKRGRYVKEMETRLQELEASRLHVETIAQEQGFVTPADIGNGTQWNGYNEEQTARKADLSDIYENSYRFTSNYVHVASTALFPLMYTLNERVFPAFGPHFRPPLPSLTFSAQALLTATDFHVAYWGAPEDPERVTELRRDIEQAFDDYRRPTFPNSMMVDLFP
jgi:hypothetical protein